MNLNKVTNIESVKPKIINQSKTDFKKRLIKELLTRDFFLLYRHERVTKIIKSFTLFDQHLDDFSGIDLAISLAFELPIEEVSFEIKELLAEACVVGVLNLLEGNMEIEKSVFEEYADKFSEMIVNTAFRLKENGFKNEPKIFFKEFNNIKPDFKVSYFENNFSHLLMNANEEKEKANWN